MATLEPTIERRQNIPAPLRRISWGAIFAGAAIATAIMMLLGLLGVAIGATISDPISGDTPSAKAFGIGAGLWWIMSGLLALLAGGWASARMAGLRRKGEGPLHGLVTWAVTTTALVVLMSSAIGAIASGAFQAVSLGTRFIDRDAVTSRAMRGMNGISGHGRHDARRDDRASPDDSTRGATSPGDSNEPVPAATEQDARQAAQAATDALAMAAWWTCLFLLLTAIAASLGGRMGAPRARSTDRPAQTRVRTSTAST
jgi:hypothetical protein